MIVVPETALAVGFLNNPPPAATDRTILLPELTLLLVACPPAATLETYRQAIIEENVLLKASAQTRRDMFGYLRGRYILDRTVPLFHALRDLWDAEPAARPQLGLLAALARDPLLRASAPVILGAAPGELVAKELTVQALGEVFPGRYQASTLAEIAQRVGTSWSQAGYLGGPRGRPSKVRRAVEPAPVAVALALLLGHCCGERGEGLFTSFWVDVLDAPQHVVRELAAVAARQGWIDYRSAGSVTEVGFRHLLRDIREGTA